MQLPYFCNMRFGFRILILSMNCTKDQLCHHSLTHPCLSQKVFWNPDLRYDFKYIKPRYFLSQILNHVKIRKKKDEYYYLLVRISTSSVITSSNAYALRKKHFWLTQLLNTASVCHIHFENCAVCMDKHKDCRWYTDQLIFPDMFWVLSILPRLL